MLEILPKMITSSKVKQQPSRTTRICKHSPVLNLGSYFVQVLIKGNSGNYCFISRHTNNMIPGFNNVTSFVPGSSYSSLILSKVCTLWATVRHLEPRKPSVLTAVTRFNGFFSSRLISKVVIAIEKRKISNMKLKAHHPAEVKPTTTRFRGMFYDTIPASMFARHSQMWFFMRVRIAYLVF